VPARTIARACARYTCLPTGALGLIRAPVFAGRGFVQMTTKSSSFQGWLQANQVALSLSLVLHALALIALSRLCLPIWNARPADFAQIELVGETMPYVPQPQLSIVIPLSPPTNLPDGTALLPAVIDQPASMPDPPNIAVPSVALKAVPPAPPQRQSLPRPQSPPRIPAIATEAPIGGGLDGRRADARARLVAERGGSPHSEAAVDRGLVWFVHHQSADGGWRFNHKIAGCDCRNAGHHESTTAATALALLPLLGAGHTPQEGIHQLAVARGLAYLRSRVIVTPSGGDLQEGTMYAQGLATIALCEACSLAPDESGENRAAAQQALDFIVKSQHPAGGWRYFPGQPGDMTVLGWQWMALKSGQLAGLNVPRQTLSRAEEFLDRVQTEGGSAYGYQRAEAERTPTAIGLLCRMYSGMRRSDSRLVIGCERLAAWGPSYDDMYFNYYATQVLHHAEAPAWTTWNDQLRNHLTAVQASRGHEAGSWYFADFHTAAGGRLCDTALALMILEVYYRHLPLYGLRSVDL